MNFGWGRAAVLACVMLAACGQAATPVDAEAAKAEAAAFLIENGKQDGVQTLPSGLQYKVVQSGPAGGASPDRNDLVKVEYEGKLADDTVFDSSFQRGAPAIFTPETVVPGWTEALQKMRVGDEWILYVPPALGYGEQGGGSAIPPNSVLIFRLKLLDVAPRRAADRRPRRRWADPVSSLSLEMGSNRASGLGNNPADGP